MHEYVHPTVIATIDAERRTRLRRRPARSRDEIARLLGRDAVR